MGRGRRRPTAFKARLQRIIENPPSVVVPPPVAAKPEEPEPQQEAEPEEPLPSFADPEARAALLEDELSDARRELDKERQTRERLERRLASQEAQQGKPRSLAATLSALQRGKRKTWR